MMVSVLPRIINKGGGIGQVIGSCLRDQKSASTFHCYCRSTMTETSMASSPSKDLSQSILEEPFGNFEKHTKGIGSKLMRHVIPILWITKEIMSRGPKVADMEYQETT
jgi:hypothetical protein